MNEFSNHTKTKVINIEKSVKSSNVRIDKDFNDIDVVCGQNLNSVLSKLINLLDNNSYIHNQSISSNVWIVNHNLGYKPGGVLVQDSAGEIWVGSINYINDNSLTITFGNAFSGKAYIS